MLGAENSKVERAGNSRQQAVITGFREEDEQTKGMKKNLDVEDQVHSLQQ